MGFDWLTQNGAATLVDKVPATSGYKCLAQVEPGKLLEATQSIFDRGYFIEDVTGLDVSEGFAVAYHFDHIEEPGRICLLVTVPHDKPEVPTISGIYSGADWHERETHDFYGIKFAGHPNLHPLLLADDMGIHPLVKDEKARKSLNDIFGLATEEAGEEA